MENCFQKHNVDHAASARNSGSSVASPKVLASISFNLATLGIDYSHATEEGMTVLISFLTLTDPVPTRRSRTDTIGSSILLAHEQPPHNSLFDVPYRVFQSTSPR